MTLAVRKTLLGKWKTAMENERHRQSSLRDGRIFFVLRNRALKGPATGICRYAAQVSRRIRRSESRRNSMSLPVALRRLPLCRQLIRS